MTHRTSYPKYDKSSDIPPRIPEDETRLETPIKVQWTGYARSRIGEYAGDAVNSSEWAHKVYRTLSRQKTNAVIHTVEEAEALAKEMNSYIDEHGPHGRTWVNASVHRVCQRVQQEIIDAMDERGYDVESRRNVVKFAFTKRE